MNRSLVLPTASLSCSAAPASESAAASAFHAHGIWVFGVLLMRKLRFRAKAVIICITFMIPVVMLSLVYFTRLDADLSFSKKERVGVDYLRTVLPLISLVQKTRHEVLHGTGASAMPVLSSAASAELGAASKKLTDIDKVRGAELGTATSYAAVQSRLSAVQNARGGRQVAVQWNQLEQALLQLLSQVTDQSNLTLDPELTSFYLMDTAFGRIPLISENTALLQLVGEQVLDSEAVTQEQQRKLDEYIVLAQFQDANLRNGLGKIKNDAALHQRLDEAAAARANAAFFEFARHNVVDAAVHSSSMLQRYTILANEASAAQYALSTRAVDALHAYLGDRIASMERERNMLLTMLALTLLGVFYFFFSFYLVTVGGLGLISKHLREMARGDLRSAPALPWGKDEPAAVIVDLRLAYDALHRLIQTVRVSSQNLHATSAEIASASVDLSNRSESAAASLEQQAAAMEQIGATVSRNAELSTVAAEFAVENARVAESGGIVIGSVVATMQEIRDSSGKIADIIGVIDSIAFQTNILALNAAVEAARAGESGRGFAVVASEVRLLAGRTAEAAAEIKHLISHSVAQVSSGAAVVEQAGSTMTSMVDSAGKIKNFLGEIALASRQQAQGVAQVSQAVHALDDDTQQNAALVEETSAACVALKQQADGLQAEIARFQVA